MFFFEVVKIEVTIFAKDFKQLAAVMYMAAQGRAEEFDFVYLFGFFEVIKDHALIGTGGKQNITVTDKVEAGDRIIMGLVFQEAFRRFTIP